jgi:DNA-binding transcriptional regulator YhcF (GntR family)
MAEGAYIPPIDVQVIEGRIIARDGHCRTRAALKLLDRGIEYMLEARQLRGNDADALFHMLGSDQGKRFSPLEHGRGFLRAVRMGHSVADIAKRTGHHRSTIENGLALAEAPAAVHKLVGEGKVSSSTALKTIRSEGATKATEALQAAVAQAQAEGKTKVTERDIKTSKPKMPSASEMWGFVQALAALDPDAPDAAKVKDLIQCARRLTK